MWKIILDAMIDTSGNCSEDVWKLILDILGTQTDTSGNTIDDFWKTLRDALIDPSGNCIEDVWKTICDALIDTPCNNIEEFQKIVLDTLDKNRTDDVLPESIELVISEIESSTSRCDGPDIVDPTQPTIE
jgi:hypothetical protein